MDELFGKNTTFSLSSFHAAAHISNTQGGSSREANTYFNYIFDTLGVRMHWVLLHRCTPPCIQNPAYCSWVCSDTDSTLDAVPAAQSRKHLFDLLIAHCLLSIPLPLSLPSSSVQVMACHRKIIGCHTAGITCRNCLRALHWRHFLCFLLETFISLMEEMWLTFVQVKCYFNVPFWSDVSS